MEREAVIAVLTFIAVLMLLATHIAMIVYLIFEKVASKGDVKEKALREAISAFEAEGHTILEIRKINPDHMFIRSPKE